MVELFSGLASLLIVLVLVAYFKQVIKGQSTPNPATWLIWSIVCTMNAVSYFLVVKGNLWQSSITIIVAVGLSSIFVYSLVKGKFGKLGKTEVICFVSAVIVGILWQITGDANLANILLQGVFLISFVPTVLGLLKRELKEKALPWNLAVVSYSCLLISVIIDIENAGWIALVHPIANGIIGNGSVALIVNLQARKPEEHIHEEN